MAANVILLLVDRPLLLQERALLLELSMRALLDERGISAHVRRRRVCLDVEYVIGDVLQKRAVVADEYHRLIRRSEIFLEPPSRLEIEMVRRLVEQKHIGRRDELARETYPSTLPPAQALERSCSRIHWVEAEPVQHRVHARRDRVASLPLEPLQIMRVAIQHLLAHRRAELAHSRGLISERLFQREELRELSRCRLPHRFRVAEVTMLLEKGYAQPGLSSDDAARWLHVARNQLEQRRLSGTVASDDAPAFARGNRECDIRKELRRPEFHCDIG